MKTVRPEKEIRQDLHEQLFAMHLRWEDWKENANAGIQPQFCRNEIFGMLGPNIGESLSPPFPRDMPTCVTYRTE